MNTDCLGCPGADVASSIFVFGVSFSSEVPKVLLKSLHLCHT